MSQSKSYKLGLVAAKEFLAAATHLARTVAEKRETAIRFNAEWKKASDAGVSQYQFFRMVCPAIPEGLDDKGRKKNANFNALGALLVLGRNASKGKVSKGKLSPEAREAKANARNNTFRSLMLAYKVSLTDLHKFIQLCYPTSVTKGNGQIIPTKTGLAIEADLKGLLAQAVATSKQTTKRTA